MLAAGAIRFDISFENVHQLTRGATAAHTNEHPGNIGGFDLVYGQETHGQLKVGLATVSQIIATVFLVNLPLRIERRMRRHPTLFEQTGVPMVLNTSFNENEPVVCRPDEALDCFLRTRMDMLVLGNWMIVRDGADG